MKLRTPRFARLLPMLAAVVLMLALVPVYALAVSKPETPTLMATHASARGETELTWTEVSGAWRYQVYRSTSKGGTYERVYQTGKYTTWTDESLSTKGYWYKVRAVASDGTKGDFSAKVQGCRKLRAPEVTPTNTFEGAPALTWDALAGATKYQVWRSTSKNGTYTKVATKATAYRFADSSASSGESFWYKVRGVDSDGVYGNFSSPKSISWSPITDNVPQVEWENNLAAWDSSVAWEEGEGIYLAWEPIEGAVSYEVYRSATVNEGGYNWKPTGGYSRLATVSAFDAASYVDDGVLVIFGDCGTDYYEVFCYKVRAVDAAGKKSSFSNLVFGSSEPYNPGD